MRRIIILLGLVIICTIICVSKYAPQDYEDRGKWVKLKEDVPLDGYILHNNAVYGCNIDKLEDLSKISPLKGIDIPTFEVCKGTNYARDKFHVYYPILSIAVDGEDFGYTYFEDYIVKVEYLWGLFTFNASPQSFKYIKSGYAIDGHIMFKHGRQIKWDNSILIE